MYYFPAFVVLKLLAKFTPHGMVGYRQLY